MRNIHPLRLPMVLLFAVSLILTSAATIAAAADSGTVSGTVELDGQPLADVEVFLFAGVPRLTCTDAAGEFLFEDVPFEVGLFSGIGPGSPEHCGNYRMRAPDGADLLTVFYDGHDGAGPFDHFIVTADEPDFFIEYKPRRVRHDEKVCFGALATVIGTPGDDILEATPGANVVYADAGNDTIKGSPEPFDLLCGGPGRDTIYGFGERDFIIGGPGLDRLYGGAGADVLLGEGARDIMYGGGGNDVLWGFGGNDRMVGGNGADIIRGHGGDDKMFGGKGFDRLYGGPGDDKAFGGPGGDTCKAEKKVSCK